MYPRREPSAAMRRLLNKTKLSQKLKHFEQFSSLSSKEEKNEGKMLINFCLAPCIGVKS